MEFIKKYKNIIKLITLLFIFLSSGLIDKLVVDTLNLDKDTLSGATKVLIILFRQSIVAIITVAFYFKELKEQAKDFKNNYMQYLDEGFKWWIVGLVIMVVTNIIIQRYTPAENMTNNEAGIREMMKALPIAMIFITSILAPITEELIFRKSFKDLFEEKWLFILTSGIVFGSLHVLGSLNSLYSLLHIIPYSGLGITFAYMYYKTNNIYTSMSMHFIHNATISILTTVGLGMIL